MNNPTSPVPQEQKEESKDLYIGEEVQKLKDTGAHIYSFDIKQNKIPDFSQNNQYNQPIGSRMRVRRNPAKI